MSVEATVIIGSMLARYAELIDAGDFAGVGALLGGCRVMTEDGTVVADGAEAIEALYVQTTRRHADGTPRTQHLITNLIVEPATAPDEPVGGGGAFGATTDANRGALEGTRLWSARSCFTVLQATNELALTPIIAGRYRDVVEERADGTWCFRERRMIPLLFGTLDHHLLFDLHD